MSSPLAALTNAYHQQRSWTLGLDHLGIAGCKRHGADRSQLPEPALAECNTKTKDPHYLCVEVQDESGLTLVPEAGPRSWTGLREMTRDLVAAGIHPLDIIIATIDVYTLGADRPNITYRSAIDHLLWTHQDQARLDKAG